MYWIMLYNAMNLNTQKEVIKAARPSLSKQMRSCKLKAFCARCYTPLSKTLTATAIKRIFKP